MKEVKYLVESKQIIKFCQHCSHRYFQCKRTCPLFTFFDAFELAQSKNIPFGVAIKLMTRKDDDNVKRTEKISK